MIFLLIFSVGTQSVKAASDETDILNQAPDGVPVGDYFSILNPTTTSNNNPFKHNAATIDSSNKNIVVLAKGNTGPPLTADSGYTYSSSPIQGAAWSDMNKDNYIDITKNQKVSVWLYFGGAADSAIKNGEGMSFVLQNDSRKNSSNQSLAMGAGLQGLGVLGWDQSSLTYTNVLGTNIINSGSAKLPSVSDVKSTAVQNSVSINFDTDRNDTMSATNLAKNGPIKLMTNKASIVNGTYYYTLSGFDTLDTGDPYGRKISTSYPGYSDLIAQRPLENFALRQGNNGGTGFGTISMTYPGNSYTYQLGKMTISNGDYSYFSSKEQSMATVQAYSQAASLTDGKYTSPDTGKSMNVYWHHVTFTWNPARDSSGNPTADGMPVSGGTPASISYDFNDKMLDGSTNTTSPSEYKRVSATIPVDPSQFGLTNGNTKVFWGLTGANSNDDGVFSKMAIFESIPALATAQVTSKIIDLDLNNQVITDDDETTTVPNRTVMNKDRLQFNYNLKFDEDSSRQNWSDILAEINLPVSDVDFTSPGTITYHTNAGSADDKTETQSIPLDWMTDDPTELQHKLAYSLGTYTDTNNPNNYTSAETNFVGTANNPTASAVTVDPELARFSGNAIETTSSPKFIIDNKDGVNGKSLKLEVSNNLAFQDVNYKATQAYIKRKNTAFTLNVTSQQSPWILQASTDGLFLNGTTRFNGNIVYRKDATSDDLTLGSNLQTIASDGNSYEEAYTTELAKDWTSETGLLLVPTATDNQAGTYTGTLKWDLINAPGSDQ